MTDTSTAMERQVLDGKDRDELASIAKALGMNPTGRSTKNSLIGQILKETGAAEATEKPIRGRKPKAESSPAAPALFDPFASPDEPPAAARNGKATVSNGNEIESTATARPSGPERNAEANEAPRRSDRRGPVRSTITGADPVPVIESEPAVEAVVASGREPRTEPFERSGPRPDRGPRNERPERGPRPERTDRFERTDRPSREPAADPGQDSSDSAESPTEEAPAGGAPRSFGDRPPFERNRDNRGDRPGGDNRGDRPDRGPRPAGGPGSGGPGGGGPGGPNQPRPFTDRSNDSRFDNDGPGGKRKRRRGRDRERERVSPERDAATDRLSENYSGELIEITGLLDLSDQGYGYVRAKGYLPAPEDVYVPVNRVRQLGLRKGDIIAGAHRPATAQEKFPAIVRVDTVNGLHPDVARLRPKFEDLTALFPDERLKLEMPGDKDNMVNRIVDLVSPIGKGQRGLIVSPPKAGKTTIMKQIAKAIEANNPDVHLMVLLIDERPEEVTDMRRTVNGEVVSSTFDKPSDEHTMIAELAIERAKRLVEEGKNVVIILDGITRLARAYNLAAPATGRIMSGGIDTGALYPPKKFFGSARNVEEGGSLTILATALIETGSLMDTVIYEEFKGTGNLELRLDRRLAEKRIYPAINVNESSTRREELLFEPKQLEAIWKLRRVLNGLAEGGSAAAGLELLMDRIKTTRTNTEFLAEIAKAPSVNG